MVDVIQLLCLLNLLGVMADFGPLPNLWEGGDQGEKVSPAGSEGNDKQLAGLQKKLQQWEKEVCKFWNVTLHVLLLTFWYI